MKWRIATKKIESSCISYPCLGMLGLLEISSTKK